MLNEIALIDAAKAGKLDAFNALILHYQDRVYTVAYRIMGDEARAADAAQDAFITAYRRLSTYAGGSFGAWLLRITTNTCYDALRYHKRRPAHSLEAMAEAAEADEVPLPSQTETPEQAVLRGELHRAIQQCINALSLERRMALVMCDVEGFSYQEIADSLNSNLGTVKSRISRARGDLRQCLQGFAELLPAEYRQWFDRE